MKQVLLALLCLAAARLAAEEAEKVTGIWPNDLYTFSIHFENDMFAKTDRYYTNGTRLSLLSQDIETIDLPDWAQEVYDMAPFFGRPGYTNNIGLALGQNIYTPRDIAISTAQPNDRPWAGWLYFGISLHHKSTKDLHKMELQLGVVGPESLAEDSQSTIHEWRDIQEPEGWDNQLGTEPGLLVTYEYKNRLARWGDTWGFGFDVIPDAGIELGNIRCALNAGATVRAGWHLPPDFQSIRIDESGYASPPPKEWIHGGLRTASVYVFAGARGSAVAHDIFLDGNTFADSPSVTRKPLVATFELGAGCRWRSWRLVYAQVLRTQEFDEQDNGQQFGSINLTWFF